MRIDALKTSPDRAGRYLVLFSDGSTLRLYRQTIEDYGLYSGKELSSVEMNALLCSARQMSAKMRAVRIVSAANVSRRDLEERLVHKGEDPSHAKQAAQWLEDLHLIDDRNTAEQIVHSCISKGYGFSRAKQALYEKRIPREYWDEALANYPDQIDSIVRHLRSKIHNPSDTREVKRAVDSLLRRGHSYRAIKEGLNQLQVETEDILEE